MLVLLNDASRALRFSYHWLLDVKYVVILTYFFRGNLLSPKRLFFQISCKGYFICTSPRPGQHIPQPLIDQVSVKAYNGKTVNGVTLEMYSDAFTCQQEMPHTHVAVG